MANLTRNGIAYNLHESPYEYINDYEVDENNVVSIRYIFSSELYLKKFANEKRNHREKINKSLSNRFRFNIIAPVISDLHLYSKIEKRGFLLKVNGVNVECLENITLDGKNLIIKS